MTAVERELRNRRLPPEVNERVVELIKQFALRGAIESPMQVSCECGLERCLTPIEMTLSSTRPFERGRVGGWYPAPTSIRYSRVETGTP